MATLNLLFPSLRCQRPKRKPSFTWSSSQYGRAHVLGFTNLERFLHEPQSTSIMQNKSKPKDKIGRNNSTVSATPRPRTEPSATHRRVGGYCARGLAVALRSRVRTRGPRVCSSSFDSTNMYYFSPESAKRKILHSRAGIAQKKITTRK